MAKKKNLVLDSDFCVALGLDVLAGSWTYDIPPLFIGLHVVGDPLQQLFRCEAQKLVAENQSLVLLSRSQDVGVPRLSPSVVQVFRNPANCRKRNGMTSLLQLPHYFGALHNTNVSHYE